MKSKNKFLLIIILAFAFLLFFNIHNSKAVIEVQDGDNTITFPDFPENVLNSNYFVLLKRTTETEINYYLCFSDDEFRHHTTCKKNTSSDCISVNYKTDNTSVPVYKLEDNNWQETNFNNANHYCLNAYGYKILLSNATIKSRTGYTCTYSLGPDDNGNFFNGNFSLYTKISYDNTEYTIPSIPNFVKNNYKYYIIVAQGKPSNNKFFLCVSNKPFKYYQKCSEWYNKYNADCIPFDNTQDHYYYGSKTDGSECIVWNNEGKFKSNVHGFSGFNLKNVWYTLLYSNEDILIYEDENDNTTEALGTFFTVPVQETTTIPVLVETVKQIPTVMAKVMKIIIPIGLTILGIGLLIYLIKQVIYSNL